VDLSVSTVRWRAWVGIGVPSAKAVSGHGLRGWGQQSGRFTMGERLCGDLQCQAPRGTNPDRTMEEALQHQATPQCPGLPPAGPRNHRPDGPKASHALTLKLDNSCGADHHNPPVPFSTNSRDIQPTGCENSKTRNEPNAREAILQLD